MIIIIIITIIISLGLRLPWSVLTTTIVTVWIGVGWLAGIRVLVVWCGLNSIFSKSSTMSLKEFRAKLNWEVYVKRRLSVQKDV